MRRRRWSPQSFCITLLTPPVKQQQVVSPRLLLVVDTEHEHADSLDVPATTPETMHIQHLKIGGYRLRVGTRPARSRRGGMPLLLCNGIGASFELLYPFVDALDDVDVIMFDAPGVGGSSTPLLPYRMAGLARTVGRMLDALGVDEVDVLGVSWGGGLAQQFALDSGDRCRKLVLAATTMGAFMVPGKPTALLKFLDPRRYFDRAFIVEAAGDLYGGLFRTNPAYAWSHVPMIRAPATSGYAMQLFRGLGAGRARTACASCGSLR